ncbi:MAG: undecaprenyl-diphosphate phosphatase [Acidimicrobiia bacterium]
MLSVVLWGLIQGLTEFLPVSSSGHLVIIPAFLSKLGIDVAQPGLAVSAVLHLGTLVAVLVYFRADVMKVVRLAKDPEGKKLAVLVLIGTLPAMVGLPLEGSVERFQESASNVGWALVGTGLILGVGHRLARGTRSLLEGLVPDAILVGVAQAIALIPGISRSGITITAGSARGFSPTEAARFSFLLGIPAIVGAGLLELPEVIESGALGWELLAGFVVAAVAGYLSIAWLLSVIKRIGLLPFSIYCLAVGVLTVVVF